METIDTTAARAAFLAARQVLLDHRTDHARAAREFRWPKLERFNGTRWSVVTSPDLVDHRNSNNYAGLSGVDATSAGNAFAVGSTTAFNAGGRVGKSDLGAIQAPGGLGPGIQVKDARDKVVPPGPQVRHVQRQGQ